MDELTGERLRNKEALSLVGEHALRRHAMKAGMRPLRLAGAMRVASGLTTVDEVVRNAPPIELGIWRGEGMVLARTDGFFAAPSAQCNATYYVNNLPDRDAVFAALTARLGMEP